MPLGWSLDLLWALRGQLRLWSGPTLVCACPQSPQLPELDRFHLWEHSSIQIFHRCRVYQADHGDLICGMCSWQKDFCSSSLVAPPLGLSYGFSPTSACRAPTGVCSLEHSGLPQWGQGTEGMAAWVLRAPVTTGPALLGQMIWRETRQIQSLFSSRVQYSTINLLPLIALNIILCSLCVVRRIMAPQRYPPPNL